MAETRRKGSIRIPRRTRSGWSWRPAKADRAGGRNLGIHDRTLDGWSNADRRRRGEGNGGLGKDEHAELVRLRRENADLRVRCDVLKRSLALWFSDAVGR